MTGVGRRSPLSGWTLEAVGAPAPAKLHEPFPADVPGSAHAALAERGDIDDLTVGSREADQDWAARTT